MAVNDKRADIAILKTMGASNTLLRLIFIVHCGMNGILGVVSGTVLGILISENLKKSEGSHKLHIPYKSKKLDFLKDRWKSILSMFDLRKSEKPIFTD